MPPDTVFPFQWELAPVLRRAMAADPLDARAPYYLGDLLFDSQPEEGLKLWEQSVARGPRIPSGTPESRAGLRPPQIRQGPAAGHRRT